MMRVENYRELVHEDIELAANASDSSLQDEFILYATGILANGEEFDDFTECHYEGVTRRNGRMAIDGYSKDEADGSMCLFISDYHGPDKDDSIMSEDINSLFRKLRLFVEEATKHELYYDMQGSDAAIDLARDLFYDSESITKYRFYLLTDAYNKQRSKTIKDDKIGEKTVELNVWDITRLFDLVCSKAQKESVEIDLLDLGYKGIPCVKAVEYENVEADIEIPVKYDTELETEEDDGTPENIVSYTSYLAVVPGQVLNDLYLEYGSKLLEGNVRSFLSVRGKVNKSIQSTIKNYPEMFFAYNNGIAATATDIETEMTSEGLVITRIKDLQIVNGGQTTASIANTLLTAKKNENVDLSKLFVPMKISVLEHSMAEKIIPKISEYSNSQNKVDASDFFSNHPFHIRMEEYSRKTPIPSVGGNQFQQYWFYERTRGQYNQGKMKFGAKSSQLKQYTDRYPEKMVITMLDLAKYMELFECAPDVVSKGKQKMLQKFADEIKSSWQKNNDDFNAFYYKRVVALAIIYKCTDQIIKETEWYKEKRSYKANVIAYTLSLIFYYIHHNKKGYELDFDKIWNMQDIYEELEDQIKVLTKEVYYFITGPRETENVTEWCKKEACWSRAKSRVWTFNDPFLYTLVSKSTIEDEVNEEKATRKVANEVDSLKEIFTRGSDYWKHMMEWGNQRGLLSEKEVSILKMIINMNYTGRIPTEKQAKVVMGARKRMIQEGMPLQF
ncbi:AIPR family protein [Butyrivibrio fibrisolvens]|uniref:AIPR family protein n=1 Tax=Butyrivibrio fibrisolvens TaxID=831 RepID=UPI00040C2ED9|nr:AIPR family protein [Butyrivibrio fibrisolvens]